MSDSLKWTLLGALSIVFGILALNFAVLTSISVTLVVGALFIVAGIAQAVAGFREDGKGSKALAVLLGVVMAVLGLSFLVNPFAGTISLSIVVTAFIGASGILRLMHAWELRGTQTMWIMVVTGLVSIALALFIIFNPIRLKPFIFKSVGQKIQNINLIFNNEYFAGSHKVFLFLNQNLKNQYHNKMNMLKFVSLSSNTTDSRATCMSICHMPVTKMFHFLYVSLTIAILLISGALRNQPLGNSLTSGERELNFRGY